MLLNLSRKKFQKARLDRGNLGSSSINFRYCRTNFSSSYGCLKQIGGAITAVGDNNPYALAVILGLIIPVVGMTPLSSMVLTSLLGLTGVPMAIGALTCTGASFANFMLFRGLKSAILVKRLPLQLNHLLKLTLSPNIQYNFMVQMRL